jgi:hypothetical protein
MIRCGFLFFASSLFVQTDLLKEEYYPARTKGVLEQAIEMGCQQFLCGRIKIKEGALAEVRNWFQVLTERKEELKEAFALEEVWVESIFLEHAQDGDYLIYYMRQNDLERAFAALGKFGLPVRLFHVDHWKNCCHECVLLEPLFDLERFE